VVKGKEGEEWAAARADSRLPASTSAARGLGGINNPISEFSYSGRRLQIIDDLMFSALAIGDQFSVVKIGKSIFFSRNHNRFSIIGA